MATAKAYNTCIADRAGVQPMGRRLILRPQTLTYDQIAIRSPGLPFNGLHPRNTWITTHLPTPEGWKAELV